MIILALSVLVEKKRINNGMNYDMTEKWFSYSHYVFTALILSNIINFGQSTTEIAILSNGAPLLIANVAYYQIGKWKYAKWLYFFAITSPIMFEVAMFLREYVPIILFVFFSHY
jgi:predicted MFS family arabinose efflux permease